MKMQNSRLALIFLVCLALLTTFSISSAQSTSAPDEPARLQNLTEQLRSQAGGQVRISYHAGTGRVRFIGTDLDHPISQPDMKAAGATPEQAARHFLATYGELFGLRDQGRELTVMRERSADRGRSFVRFQQTYKGIPVLGGELIVQVDAARGIVSANGEILPDLALDTTPRLDAAAARGQALGVASRGHDLDASDLVATEPELWVYNPILLKQGPDLDFLAWRVEVTAKDELLPVRELVLVDARSGFTLLHFNQIDTARNRLVYDNNNDWTAGLPGIGPVCTEGSCPGSGNDYNYAYDYAGDTYDFYATYHGRDSLDDAGMTLVSTVRYCPDSSECPYANAFWNGAQMVYGDGYSQADDVVAHEMTHGVTTYESNLFYYMQSGAINEGFSDIWGEFVDLTNGAGNDTPGVRWLMGEEIGAIRSMSNPPAYGDPDSISSVNYYCGEGDNGGVHFNSGVANKAAYLMVDGDTFNSITVTGIGINKTATIWYEVQTNLFTSASDYQDLYDGLQQACTNLVGTVGITAADCQEVKDAVDATEMYMQPPSCPATEAPVCTGGGSPTDLFFDDMENTSSGNWTHAAISGSDEWYYPQNPNPYNVYGFDATYATSGQYNIWGYDQPGTADYYIAMTSGVALPAASTPYLHFNHSYAFDDYLTTMYDGGVLEYSAGGGPWTDAGSLFTHNGYDGTIASGYGNPLDGRQAFGGESNGYISSRLDLSSLAGQSVRFRFRIGTDSYPLADALGWFIDDVRIYTCGGGTPAPNVGIDKQVVGSDHAPGDPVTFTLTIANNGSDVATNVVVTDAIPSEVQTPAYASTLAITPTGAISYVWEVEPLGIGQNGTITIWGWIDPGLATDFSFDNTATISATGDDTPGNNISSVTVSGGEQERYLPLAFRNSPPVVTDNFYAMADTTVLQGHPGTNYGGASDMWAGYDHCSYNGKISRSLVRFDVSSIPPGTNVTQARLYLHLVNSCDIGERTHKVTTYRVNSSWSSSTVTWNTRPGFAESYGSRSIPSRTWGWYSFDVTSLVRGWVNGTYSNYGLMLRGPESSGDSSARLGFGTVNSSYDPYLSITYLDVGGSTGEALPSEEIPGTGECGPAIMDMFGVFPGIPGYEREFEAIEGAICP